MNTYKFEDLHIGLNAEFVVTVTKEMVDSFLNISQDNNPLHVDVQFAKNRGFKDKVVYGMLTSSFYSKLIGVYLPGRHCLLHGIKINFNHPVFTGDVLTVHGEISYVNETYKQIEIKAHITNQDNKKVSTANIKVGVNE